MASRFSVLRIEDDSDDERLPTFVKGKQNGIGNKAKPHGNKQKNGSLVVHAVERQRPKVKKNNKEKLVDPATGYVVQETGFDEDLKKEKVRQALAAVSIPLDESPVYQEESVGQPTPDVGQELEAEARKLNISSADQTELSRFYKNRLLEVTEQLNAANEAMEKSRERADYYKDRYRKLVELFKDAECQEKAKLVLDLDRSNTAVAELTGQLSLTTKSLEQTRSRLSAYENKK